MHHSSEHIWTFLRSYGVTRVRRVGDNFEFLIGGNTVPPAGLFRRMARDIGSRRPEKIHLRFQPRMRRGRRYSVFMDEDDRRIEQVMGFRNEEDKLLDQKCDAELKDLGVWWNDLTDLFNLIRFGVEIVPPDLTTKPEHGLPRIGLADAMNDLSKLLKRLHGKKSQIDLCCEYLKGHEIEGKPGYSPEKLSNALSKYMYKLSGRLKLR